MRRTEHLRLAGFGGVVALLHLAGWGLFLFYIGANPALSGLGLLAYTFGLRHAFDADHIAAIDNTARRLVRERERSLGVGFFFSLGHSTIVFVLVAGIAFASSSVSASIPVLQHYGAPVGAGVSGAFLWVIGVLNLLVLIDIARMVGALRAGRLDADHLERRLRDRGFLNRFLAGRFASRIASSWQMYPLGLLFGLGFDTATEVGLLVLAATSASHGTPFLAVLSLPLLFAAGMSMVDTADGVFMSHAYGWAFANPVRRMYYNITVTSLSVVVALAIGTIEFAQIAVRRFQPDLGALGYAIVGLFVLTWAISAIVWKAGRIEERWAGVR
ncbi:MAG TPA: HoxN/HupN/NixA family nickel/cobalt transporter [Gaiellaceae bacterium]|nr:HoxN/HupN/NixA family nickel/cobalt transporter [Gaiellaceae bacterium]